MQNVLIINTLLRVVLIVVTIITGIFLHKTGTPYNTVLFTFHKLATIAFIVFQTRTMLFLVKETKLTDVLLIFLIISISAVLGLMFSGGAMSLDKNHKLMLNIHRISTMIFIPAISIVFYSILKIINR